eukprot:1627663-Pyramimonas_sp.AAC.1
MYWGLLGASLGASWGPLEGLTCGLGGRLGPEASTCQEESPSWASLWALWGSFWQSWAPPGAHWDPSGAVLGALLGTSWAVSGRSRGPPGASWSL